MALDAVADAKTKALVNENKKLRAALKPIVKEALQRAPFMEKDYNPGFHIELSLTVRELRAAFEALAAHGGHDA